MALGDPTTSGDEWFYRQLRQEKRSFGATLGYTFVYGWCFALPVAVAVASFIQWLI